jgi:prolyl 4-hydroxylase
MANWGRYGRGHFFREHYDWFDPDKDNHMGATGNRKTSIFAYLVTECQGGTTVFPRVKRPQAPEWCDSGLLKCVDDNGNDVEWLEVQPKEGVAIFWQNFNGNGELDQNTLHAGADVLNGTKYGLNIWTREGRFRYNDYE